MQSSEKPKKEAPPDVLTQQEFSSLKKSEKYLGMNPMLLEVLKAVRDGEAWVDIVTNKSTGLKTAIIRLSEEIVFSTQDQGEVAAFELLKNGKNLVLDPSPEEDDP